MGKKRVVGILFIAVSILISLSNITLVGAVIGAPASNFLGIVALAFFVVGAVLVIYEEMPRKRIEDIVRKYERGKIDVINTAYLLNKTVPIQNVRYTERKQHSIVGERNASPIGLRAGSMAQELPIVEYLVSEQKGLSTKHYMKAFKKTVKNFKEAHKHDLASVLGIT